MLYDFIIKNIYIVFTIISIILILVFIEINDYKYQKSGITPQEAIRLINNNNAKILDFREEDLYNKSYILNSINMPFSKLLLNTNTINKYKKNIILIIENKKNNYKNIIKLLNQNDCKNILYIIGGIESWTKNNLPIYKK